MDVDNEAIELIRQQVRLDIERTTELKRQNDLAERAIQLTAESEVSRKVGERNRLKLLIDSSEKLDGLIIEIKRVFLAIYGMEESLREAERRQDRQDDIMLILLTGRGNGNRVSFDELTSELKSERTQRLIRQEYENLQELEEQAAQYGAGNEPLKLKNQIRATQRKIAELETKLKGES